MSTKNEVEVVECSESAMTVSKGTDSITFSPDIVLKICEGMIGLGVQLVAETGKVTVEYFQTQANMYYQELDTYIKEQTLYSDERKKVLDVMEKLTDKYSSLISETEDEKKRAQLIEAYDHLYDRQAKLYIEALDKVEKKTIPYKPDLLGGIKKLFSK